MKAFLSENPLKSIFKLTSKGVCTEEINSVNKIDTFFKYLKDEKNPSKFRCQMIEEFINKLKINRYLCEFFSQYENESIYIFLVQLYINKKTPNDLKSSIINLINELKINLDINKNIYDYLFQKIAAIYREEESLSNNLFYDYLMLLNTFLGDTLNHLKPRNYFCCSGEGCFEVDFNQYKLRIGCSFTFILNFKIGTSTLSQEEPDKSNLANLISINFSNGEFIDFDLQYPMLLVVKQIQDKFIKTLPMDEWINLVINIVIDDKDNLIVFCFVNGENNLTSFQVKKINLTINDRINSIKFFNNFYGEVSSISFLWSLKDYGFPGVNASDFLLEFKNFNQGLWKKKKIDSFLKLLKEFDAIGIEKNKSKTVWKKPAKIEKKFEKNEKDSNRKLIDNLIFTFTPLNYFDKNKNMIENVLGPINMKFSGNIRPHKFHCYQKRAGDIGIITNILPIAEMFLIHPELLNENNFDIFLNIIKNLLNNRKHNMKYFSECSFFQILSLFIEKYPKTVFTEKTLTTFADIGKCMFENNIESLSSIYFEHILLNEKILSKYSEDLQIKFWAQILLFCQSDSSQIEVFINMNRICLILRFYDRNKYTEMCCQHHLSMIKEKFKGNKEIMNPPMDKKLLGIQNILNVIINSQEPQKSFSLFKLLTLDLSPCLTRFIINIFITAFQKETQDNKWKDNFIKVLINNKYETIIANTFVYSLPEIKFSLLKLMFEINFRLLKTNKIIHFKSLEKIIKQILLPQDNFYSKEIILSNNDNSSNSIINTKNINELNKPQNKKLNTNENKKKMLNSSVNNMQKPIKKEDNKKNEKKNFGINSYSNKNYHKKEEPKKPINAGAKNNKISSLISKMETLGEGKFPGIGPKKYQNKVNDSKNNLSKSVMVFSTNTESDSNNNEKLNIPSSNTSSKNDKRELTEKSTSNNNDDDFDLNLKNKNGEILIFKENLYFQYVENVYKLFLLWALNLPINFEFKKINFNNSNLESANALEFLFSMIIEINDINYYLKLITNIESLSNNSQNAFKIISNEKIISYLLDIAFKFYKSNDNLQQKCHNMIKSILMNSYINALSYAEKLYQYPCDKVEAIFLWGDKVLFKEKNRKNKDLFFDFMFEFLFEFLTIFKIKNDPLMNFNLTKPNFTSNPSKNFYLRNYFILITHLFRFSFNYKQDEIIRTEGLTFISLSPKVNNYLIAYITGMKMDPTKGQKMDQMWLDFPFFDDIYRRINVIWYKNKKLDFGNKKEKNKIKKYQHILEKIILDKNNKNIFQKELELLCYEEVHGEKEQVIPLIKVIPIGLMCIIHSSEIESEFLHWLKEFRKFIKFLIIASSNLTRANQLDLYNNIQEQCINVLISSICFLKELKETKNFGKEKVRKCLNSILLFCFLIVKYQYNYINTHKGIKKIKLSGKPSRNDLISSAIFILFYDLIKDKTGQPLLSQGLLETLELTQYVGLAEELDSIKWNEAFIENNSIRERLCNKFYTINNYKKIVENRIKLIKIISEEKDEKYKEDILQLLPLYEKELLKYSNNSLEKNKKIKNIYKKFKKQSFSWYGFWSDRKLFFQNTEKLKLKFMNHLTKTLMKPVLVPILDISYYLPEFSGFDPSNLFNQQKIQSTNDFKLIMDIDKILKSSEQINLKETKNKNLEINKENFLREIYSKSNPQLAESLKKISNNLDFGKEEEFAIIKDSSNKDKEQKKYFLSCLVKTSHHIKGVCFIDDENLNFKVFLNQRTGNAMSGIEIGFTTEDDDYDQERQTCFGSYFICHPKDKDLYKISINYNDIKWIFRRRYYYKNSALEIYTTTNKTFYFNFKYEDERETVIIEILNKLNDPTRIIDDLKDQKDLFENVIGFENSSVVEPKRKEKKIKISKKIESWKEWKITNYELLMWLNIFGNRSFNDISQYPVFPWILNNYQDPLKNENEEEEKYHLRDMSLPMGMMTLDEKGEQRKEAFMLNYETLKESQEEGMKPYMFGSNYSNPIYVCYYLMRIFPFTHIAIELQGSKFDDPNRLFISVENSFFNSTTQKTDVRELIPEFYYLPEIFLNINDLNMGTLDNGKKVNDIITPCHNNPYMFVSTMKSILESDEISNTIQNWVDLIFGSKACGKEAENANNLFTEASYQENIDIKNVENKESYLRMVEFGLIPSQIMNKDCSKREKKDDLIKGKEITNPEVKLIIYDCKPVKEQTTLFNNKNNSSVLIGKELSQDKITLLLNNNYLIEKKLSFSIFDKGFTDEIINIIPLMNNNNKMSEFYSNNSNNNKVFHILNKAKLLIMGGFYDGKIVIYFLEERIEPQEILPFNNDSPILSLCVDQEEEFLMVGNSIGNVAVYKINSDLEKWSKIKELTEQKNAISHLFCSSDLNLWVSTSIDGYVNLYTLPLCKLVRTIKISTTKCSYSFLSCSPLPSIVIINDESNNSEIIVYSLNGKLITKQNLYFKLTNPILIKDLNANEYLVYIGKDFITFHCLPTLDILVNVDILPGIHTIFTSEDKKSLYCISKSGAEVYIIKDEIKKNLRNASILMNL